MLRRTFGSSAQSLQNSMSKGIPFQLLGGDCTALLMRTVPTIQETLQPMGCFGRARPTWPYSYHHILPSSFSFLSKPHSLAFQLSDGPDGSGALVLPIAMSDVELTGDWKDKEQRNQEVLMSLNRSQWACHFTTTVSHSFYLIPQPNRTHVCRGSCLMATPACIAEVCSRVYAATSHDHVFLRNSTILQSK